jgi:hypothetical protein
VTTVIYSVGPNCDLAAITVEILVNTTDGIAVVVSSDISALGN